MNDNISSKRLIFIGSDHGGFKMKETLKKYLESKNIIVKDIGTNSNKSCDYPEIVDLF